MLLFHQTFSVLLLGRSFVVLVSKQCGERSDITTHAALHPSMEDASSCSRARSVFRWTRVQEFLVQPLTHLREYRVISAWHFAISSSPSHHSRTSPGPKRCFKHRKFSFFLTLIDQQPCFFSRDSPCLGYLCHGLIISWFKLEASRAKNEQVPFRSHPQLGSSL